MKRKRPLSKLGILFAALVLLAAFPASSHAQYVTETYGVAPDGTVLNWDVYKPSGPGPWPAAIVIHGGGWHGGGPHIPDLEQCAQDLASAGYLALAIYYRLDKTKLPGQTSSGCIPEQTDDCKMAVRAARARSDCNGEVVAVGGSAGGAHAAFLAVTGTAGVDRVDAAVCLSGAMDFSDWRPDPNIDALKTDIETYCSVPSTDPPSAESIAIMRSASPAWQPLSPATTAPMFLIATEDDPMPHTQLPDMVAALRAHGIAVTTYPAASRFQQLILPGDLHEFAYWIEPDASVKNAAIEFLDRVLPVPPTPSSGPTPPPAPEPSPSQLLNISTRAQVQDGDEIMSAGFIVSGNNPKRVLIRGLGPSLSKDGAAMADPVLALHDANETVIASNDNWKDTQESEIQATGIPPTNNLESALIATIDPGNYTAVLSGKNGGVGLGLVEVYDLDERSGSRLGNLSTRGFVGTSSNVIISGFILGGGSGNDTVLVRALGPSLSARGIPNALPNPTMSIRDVNGTVVAANDDWKSNQEAQIEATGVAPTSDLESAVFVALSPGAYTTIVSGVGGSTGVGLVEVYDLHH
jgi:acetyl esterase/lipase